MPLLSDQDSAYLRQTFEAQLVNDVTISLFTQRETRLAIPGFEEQAELCGQANAIMEELAGLSDKIHLELFDYRTDAAKLTEFAVDRVPTALVGAGTTRPARFIGVVAGYEFSTLIQDIIDLSTDTIELTDETKAELAGLAEDLHLQVFVTPT
jgi:alkyl hydroperoxide reductase subunit AhpF